jgi:hypothetical protein
VECGGAAGRAVKKKINCSSPQNSRMQARHFKKNSSILQEKPRDLEKKTFPYSKVPKPSIRSSLQLI